MIHAASFLVARMVARWHVPSAQRADEATDGRVVLEAPKLKSVGTEENRNYPKSYLSAESDLATVSGQAKVR